MGVPVRCRGSAKIDSGLATELDYDLGGVAVAACYVSIFVLKDISEALLVEGFEIESVAGVKVGGNGLGVGVDHDGPGALLLEGPGSVDAAVVELYALADADGAGADYDSPAARYCLGLVLLLVGAVEIGGLGGEFCGAGVDHLIDGTEAPELAEVADLLGEAVG